MKSSLLFAALVGLLLPAPAALAEDGPSPAARLAQARAESVVSIQFVLKTRIDFGGQSQDQESNREVRGVLLSAGGLVLTASSHFDGGPARQMVRMMGDIDVDMSATDIKVLFGNEAQEYRAQIVAKDSDLGLAFLQILDLGDRKVVPLALADAAPPSVGQDLLAVSRLARGFDCAPAVARLYVTAAIEKPRAMWAVAGDGGDAGLPAFASDGRLAGVLTVQQGAEGASDEGGGGLFDLGGAGENMGRFLLPTEALAPLITLATERAKAALEEAAKGGAPAQAGAAAPPEAPVEAPTR